MKLIVKAMIFLLLLPFALIGFWVTFCSGVFAGMDAAADEYIRIWRSKKQ